MSLLLLRTLALGRRQQSESIEVDLIMEQGGLIKGAVYAVVSVFYQELDVFGAVPVRKNKIKFVTKGGIHFISRSSLGIFILRANPHWSN